MICIYHAFKQDCLRKVVITLIIKAQRKFQNKVTYEDSEEPTLDVPNDEITLTVVELSELLIAKENN